MNRDRAIALLPVIQAYADGAKIQCRECDRHGKWRDVESPTFAVQYEYRVKPEPVRPELKEAYVVVRDGDQAGMIAYFNKEQADNAVNSLKKWYPKNTYTILEFQRVVDE